METFLQDLRFAVRNLARTPAFLGRTLLPSDAARGAEPVVVLAYRTWQVGVGALIAAPILAVTGAAATYFLPLGGVVTAIAGVAVSTAIMLVVLGATWLLTRRVVAVPLRDALWRD